MALAFFNANALRTKILDRIGEKFCGSNRESNNSTFHMYIYIYIYRAGPTKFGA